MSRPANLGPATPRSRSTGSIMSGSVGGSRMGMFSFASDDDMNMNMNIARNLTPDSYVKGRRGGGGGGTATELSSSATRQWLRGGAAAGGGNDGNGGNGTTSGGQHQHRLPSTTPSSITYQKNSSSNKKLKGTSTDTATATASRGRFWNFRTNSNLSSKSNSPDSQSQSQSELQSQSRGTTLTTPSLGSMFSFPDDPLAQSNRYQPVMYSSLLGDIYSNSNAMKAYRASKLKSKSIQTDDNDNGDGNQLRVFFVNKTSQTLVLCWVGFDNKLNHYYKLKPSSATTITGGLGGSGSDRGNALDIRIEGGVHSEQTYLGHSFVIGTCSCESESGEYENSIICDDEEETHDDDGDVDADAYGNDDNHNDGNHQNKFPSCWSPFSNKSTKSDPISIHDADGDGDAGDDNTCFDFDRSKMNKIIAAYRPKRIMPVDHVDDDNNDDDIDDDDDDFDMESGTSTGSRSESGPAIHMVTITEEMALLPRKKRTTKRGPFLFQQQETITSFMPGKMYHLSVTQCQLDSTPVDQTKKEYENMVFGGWRVKCEKGLFSSKSKSSSKLSLKSTSSKSISSKSTIESKKNDANNGNGSTLLSPWRSKILSRSDMTNITLSNSNSNSQEETALAPTSPSSRSPPPSPPPSMDKVRERLEMDLAAVTTKLPPAACRLLKKSTLIWINRSQIYGPKAAPITARGMCYHPNRKWLLQVGMSPKKWRGVELYDASNYLSDADLWYGVGGVMLHELSHAFHHKFVKGGYENQDIIDCYNAAMEEGLYDKVEVHTPGGGKNSTRRAYACTNAMEYFAELSVAFLGGVGKDKDLEFNKWYPFNRKQLKRHDPRAYELLKRLWLNEENYSTKGLVEFARCMS